MPKLVRYRTTTTIYFDQELVGPGRVIQVPEGTVPSRTWELLDEPAIEAPAPEPEKPSLVVAAAEAAAEPSVNSKKRRNDAQT